MCCRYVIFAFCENRKSFCINADEPFLLIKQNNLKFLFRMSEHVSAEMSRSNILKDPDPFVPYSLQALAISLSKNTMLLLLSLVYHGIPLKSSFHFFRQTSPSVHCLKIPLLLESSTDSGGSFTDFL